MATYGFCGLGIMGSRMAACLLRAGHELVVWTHTPGKAATWAQEHPRARAVETPAEVAAATDTVITMVVDGPQVLALTGELALTDAQDRLLVDMSTIGPQAVAEVAARLPASWSLVDAPVTGSAPKAEDGTLTIMAGGSEQDVARARPAFAAMGEVVLHVGPLGQGQVVKLVNNAVAAVNAATLAEALLVASAAGADLEATTKVLQAGSGGSRMVDLKAAPMREHDFTTLFKLEHMLKDVRLCLDQAQAAGVPFTAAAGAADALQQAADLGHGQADFAAVLSAYEQRAGRRL